MISNQLLIGFLLVISKTSSLLEDKWSTCANMIDNAAPRLNLDDDYKQGVTDEGTTSSILSMDLDLKYEPRVGIIPSYLQNVDNMKQIEENHLYLTNDVYKTSKNSKCAHGKCRETLHKYPAVENKNDYSILNDIRRKVLTKGLLKLVKPTLEEVLKKPSSSSKKQRINKVKYCTEVITTTPLPRLNRRKKIKSFPTTPFHNVKKTKELHQKTLTKVKQVSKLKEIVRQYESLFRGLGCEQEKCHVTINENNNTDDIPRKITVALKNDLKKELDNMEKLGIIIKDKAPTSWIVYLPQRNKMREADKIAAKIIHGDADELVLDSLRSENSEVHIAKAPHEKMVTADGPADDAVDGGDLPMYEMESFYRDISLNDHLSWVHPQPTTYLKYLKTTAKPFTATTEALKNAKTTIPTTQKPSLRELTLSRIKTIINNIKDSSTTQRSETQRSFLYYHSKKRRH